ncbi:MAG: RsmF rRNA methyltransferase first C-terminal domain-containing protein [Lachnospiraceae bacterium]
MNLPEQFQNQMKGLLEDYEDFLASYDQKHHSGIRLNTLKITSQQFQELSGLKLEPVPWTPNGYYYDGESSIAKNPMYYAGLYYIQEPSAMTPAAFLPIEPGDTVLDLCAAPGGKSTELGARLCGRGLLVSNDISNTRAKALYKNIELFGIRNALVLSEPPERLAPRMQGFFDKILIDAPCSGEGMFRKKPAGITSWIEYGPEFYAKLQREILEQAVTMLKPGGMLLYSTCTFSPLENEGSVAYILEQFPEMSIEELPLPDGFDQGHPEWENSHNEDMKKCRRLWPHRIKGEGHFVALLKKDENARTGTPTLYQNRTKSIPQPVWDFLKDVKWSWEPSRIEIVGDKVFYLPETMPDVKGLRILGSGLLLGFIKKQRFEPAQAFAMALKPEEYTRYHALSYEDERVIKYLKCETIPMGGEKGYTLVGMEGYPLGWGKVAGGMCKNKYYPGWRWM